MVVIKIGKLIFSPIKDIFILVLIDYNTLHLAHTERADQADNSDLWHGAKLRERERERESCSHLIVVYGQETINTSSGVTRAPPPVQHLADTHQTNNQTFNYHNHFFTRPQHLSQIC